MLIGDHRFHEPLLILLRPHNLAGAPGATRIPVAEPPRPARQPAARKETTMMRLVLAVIAILGCLTTARADDDARTPVHLPPDVRTAFLAEMRVHMESLDDVMAAVAAGDFKDAARLARDELAAGSGKGFGRYLPIEFREIGLAMHRAAADFADVAAAMPVEPGAADWRKLMIALEGISSYCRTCHGAFRVE
jgi:hypothetical protein